MPLRTVNAIRYITSLREGGSLPALVEADDGRMFVVKLRGAGQGPRALVAEILAGEIARSLGLRVPEIVLVSLDAAFAKTEPDPEIQDLFRSSTGVNAGLEFLPESTIFDPAAGDEASPSEASRTVWLDSFTLNVDRTAKNANLLLQRGNLWLIDHGASLYVHFNWQSAEDKVRSPFSLVREHILLRWAEDIAAASALARNRLTPAELRRIVDLVPDGLLASQGEDLTPWQQRARYLDFLLRRLENSSIFEEEIRHARADAV